MRIRYKISILVILLTVAIIVLINYSYVRIMTWAIDDFIKRYLPHQITSAFLDLPPDSEIEWKEMETQIDRAMQEFDDLLYVAVYSAGADKPKILSTNMPRIQSLLNSAREAGSPQEITSALGAGELNIKNARTVELLSKTESGSSSLRVVIGYVFPILDQMRSFIVWIALILILIFTIVAVLVSFLLASRITRPIRRLASAMQNVSEGDLDIAVRPRSRDEVGQLAKAFNKMIYQLREKTTELEQLNQTLEERVQRGVEEIRRRDEAERQRLFDEIQRAREMQMGLLPQSPPRVPGLDIWGVCYPASEVGGDFFDYLSLNEEKLCIALGDVSGKGLRGAMNGVMAYGMLHAQVRTYSSASTTIYELNATLSSRLEEATFTALSLGIIDINSKEVQLCNAGNPYPILLRMGKASLLNLSGMPLGIVSEIEYDETHLVLRPGDALIFYSDGISEAMTSDDQLYGMDRLRDLVGTFQPGLGAQAMVERILQDVRRFVGEFPQSDDMTIVVVNMREVS
jgi:serine phosphatase RsbU (regulator of sigma subunit)